jgi:hypothetical protein
MLMTPTEHVVRHQMTSPGSDAKPAQRQRLILRDTPAIQKNLPEQGLGIEYTFAGGDQNRLRSARRAFLEHGF